MPKIRSEKDVWELVDRWGFLPFFRNTVPGFSIEEHTPREIWFSDVPGPWEWKGPVIRLGGCAYGKLFASKAGYISERMLPDFLNYRRDGYDFDSRYECGLAGRKDLDVFDTVSRYGSLLSKKLKSLCGYTRSGGQKGFDGVITRLQMQGYICVSDFEYMVDKTGKTYGWGVARYSTFDGMFGEDLTRSAYSREPSESFERLVSAVEKSFPDAPRNNIEKLLVYR